MSTPLLNNNKSPALFVGVIEKSFEIKNGDIRYYVKVGRNTMAAIPLINGNPFKPGDQVILIFQDSKIKDVPFIVGKYNQKSSQERLLTSEIKKIEKSIDKDSLIYENGNSIISLEDKKKKITIQNKNCPEGSIIIDNNQIYIGGVDFNNFIKEIGSFRSKSLNNETISSKKDLFIKADSGKVQISGLEFFALTNNFVIKNKNDMMIQTNHINFSASFIEFNAISPKGYNMKEKNAYSFFAVDGNFAITLGKGNFNLKTALPTSEFNFLIMPLSPISNAKKSVAGMSMTKSETIISHMMGMSSITLKNNSYENELLFGAAKLGLKSSKFEVSTAFGMAELTLSATKFKVSISGNSIELSTSGFKLESGNIEASSGDVKASKQYSLMKHKHPTAVPGGPSPPTPA